MKLFLKRKSKSKSTSNQSVNDVSGLPSNTPPVKSSSLAARHSINLSPIKSEASITPVIVNATQSADTRQDPDVEELPSSITPHTEEMRDPIMYINSITTTSSASTEQDDMSQITVDGGCAVDMKGCEQELFLHTNGLKQYVVDHLLGCVDFIEDCAVTMKDTPIKTSAIDIQEGENVELRTVISSVDKPLSCNQVLLDPAEIKTVESSSKEERKLHKEIADNILVGQKVADSIPTSDYMRIKPRSTLDTIALKTNHDFQIALSKIDAIIDSDIAQMCRDIDINACAQQGLCGCDDDLSQFEEPLHLEADSNVLFQ
eukprot:scaffold306851_cov79-Cyclotella_meneghiniana.AAC.1